MDIDNIKEIIEPSTHYKQMALAALIKAHNTTVCRWVNKGLSVRGRKVKLKAVCDKNVVVGQRPIKGADFIQFWEMRYYGS